MRSLCFPPTPQVLVSAYGMGLSCPRHLPPRPSRSPSTSRAAMWKAAMSSSPVSQAPSTALATLLSTCA
ncbi:hypothetical protein D3C86_2208540 [compost metagenome]